MDAPSLDFAESGPGGAVLFYGVDLAPIARIEHAITRWGNRFLQRVWTPGELHDCGGRSHSLAARWAAKEATAKALGVGVRGVGAHAVVGALAVGWHEIEVVRDAQGKPGLRLHGAAAARARLLGWHAAALSLSHTHELALASVVAWGGGA